MPSSQSRRCARSQARRQNETIRVSKRDDSLSRLFGGGKLGIQLNTIRVNKFVWRKMHVEKKKSPWGGE